MAMKQLIESLESLVEGWDKKGKIRCDIPGCGKPATHIGEHSSLLCARCAGQEKDMYTRKMTKAEIKKLESGGSVWLRKQRP